jgi:hypothetical protein
MIRSRPAAGFAVDLPFAIWRWRARSFALGLLPWKSPG